MNHKNKELELKFQHKIDNDTKIEPNDWMPDEYRKTLIRQISQPAAPPDKNEAAMAFAEKRKSK